MTKRKLFLGVILSICFASGVSAQDAKQDSTEKPATEKVDKKKKKGKRGAKRKEKIAATFVKEFSAIEMSDEQTTKLTELIEEHFESIVDIQKQMDEMIPAEDKKTRREAMKAAKEEGKKYPEALKAGFEAIGFSEDDQEKFNELNKSRGETLKTIRESLMETFTDEQKELVAAAKPKKGKKGKKGKKEMKKDDADSSLVSVSIKLPGMT